MLFPKASNDIECDIIIEEQLCNYVLLSVLLQLVSLLLVLAVLPLHQSSYHQPA